MYFAFSVSPVLKLVINVAAYRLSVKTQPGFKANYISLSSNLSSTYNVVYYYFPQQTKLASSSSKCFNLSGTKGKQGQKEREREEISVCAHDSGIFRLFNNDDKWRLPPSVMYSCSSCVIS